MATAPSLRLRLFVLILAPLLLVAMFLGLWRFSVAQSTAETLFDRGLLAAALAISRDVASSEGDALSPRTRSLISDAGGGEVFYHVTGPGGIYVTGYAYPPAWGATAVPSEPEYRVATYRGERVRVLRMSETTTIENLTGQTVVTVWQRISERNDFAAALAWRASALIGALMATLAVVVWFGVQWGLRPLNDLQEAIERRTPDDLGLIQRPVPKEVKGIVSTLNRLFAQVDRSIQSHQAFISDAAHQLRNPASAILSLAETLPGATDPEERRRRERALITAARKSARLAEQLLSMERLRHGYSLPETSFDPVAMAQEVCADLAPFALERDIDFSFSTGLDSGRISIRGDQLLLAEALGNLIDNALQHGGPALSRISVTLEKTRDMLDFIVADDGKGVPAEQVPTALSRFGQVDPGAGSGLGLSIADEVARLHGGEVRFSPSDRGTRVTLRISMA
ncbi:sensor histidine kinase [Mameliella sp.]|uniref:sensor histidine kinase n=1 Tax=Mameliella sp. TaxID=1924940 RepID=UPI003BA8D014